MVEVPEDVMRGLGGQHGAVDGVLGADIEIDSALPQHLTLGRDDRQLDPVCHVWRGVDLTLVHTRVLHHGSLSDRHTELASVRTHVAIILL